MTQIEGLVHSLGSDIFWDCPVGEAEYERLQKPGNEAELEKATDHGPVAGYHEAMGWIEQVQTLAATLRKIKPESGELVEVNAEEMRLFMPITEKFIVPAEIATIVTEGACTPYAQNPPYTLGLLLAVAQDRVSELVPDVLMPEWLHEPSPTMCLLDNEEAQAAVKWLQDTIALYGDDVLIDCM